MAVTLTLDAVNRAWATRDPQFVPLLGRLATQPDPEPATPLREGALTFDAWLAYLKSPQFRRLSKEEQKATRVAKLAAVEAPTAEVPLPDRLKAHEPILALWRSDDPLARDALLRVIAEVPLVYGPWRALKLVFKEAEARNDWEVFGALAARFDAPDGPRTVSAATLGYLARRAWRYLRKVGRQLPAAYPDAAVEVLRHYTLAADATRRTWVLNHVFYHGTGKYGRGGFHLPYRGGPTPSDTKHRAYADLWKRSPRPLFTLLERAESEPVREFAVAGLKADFKPVLREVEPAWVARLVGVPSATVHEFMVWLFQNVPTFEQGAFRTLALHGPVLRLLDSPSAAAARYAADYARTHARDIPVEELVRLFDGPHEPVRKLARDLLADRDPRTGVGLAAWGRLLEGRHGSAFAAEVLLKAFGAKELTPDWFADRLLSRSMEARAFARANLLKVHAAKDLGAGYFVRVLQRTDVTAHDGDAVGWVFEELAKLGQDAVPAADLRFLAVFPPTAHLLVRATKAGRFKWRSVGLDFLKAMAYRPDFDAAPWLADLRATGGEWAKRLSYDEQTAGEFLKVLADVREFGTAEIGLDWLLTLAARPEPAYHTFARERMVRTLGPADFAPEAAAIPATAPTAADLGRKPFLFTGKLATMTRDEAEAKVRAANGVVAGSVTKALAYLVIGDDGSPLYGAGKKGTKQVKAEQLNEAGANIAVVSETAFLQMIAGVTAAPADADATRAGTDRLWAMATAPGPADAPLAAFARDFLKAHHTPLAKAATGKGPDPGTEVPAALMSWDRFAPLFGDSRRPLREFALAFANHDFARWNPPPDDLAPLAESGHADVRRFVAKALLAEPSKEAQPYRLDATTLDPAAVYRFVESANDEARGLGLELIRRQPRLRVPGELFRLTESTDRLVRAFVIRALWYAYRDRELTEGWTAPRPPAPTVGVKAKKDAAKRAAADGDGVPVVPAEPPAGPDTLAGFLRRVLFELPPGPPPKSAATGEDEGTDKRVTLKPIPARRSKAEAVTVIRDLALEDPAFAAGVLPLLDEFLLSSGAGERAACLVAVTRIRHRLNPPTGG